MTYSVILSTIGNVLGWSWHYSIHPFFDFTFLPAFLDVVNILKYVFCGGKPCKWMTHIYPVCVMCSICEPGYLLKFKMMIYLLFGAPWHVMLYTLHIKILSWLMYLVLFASCLPRWSCCCALVNLAVMMTGDVKWLLKVRRSFSPNDTYLFSHFEDGWLYRVQGGGNTILYIDKQGRNQDWRF